VLGVTSYGDLTSFAQQQSRGSAFILSIDDEEFSSAQETGRNDGRPARLRREIRFRNADIPIFLYGETRPAATFRTTCCASCTASSTCSRTRRSSSRATSCARPSPTSTLAPPFFRALTHYAADGSYSWHCPGHSGGVAFLKSPVGQMFHQFFGENMLRADVCNAVEELGQLLDHTGPVAASERNAARIFNCDHLYFVTNGTSTSNKMVWHSTVAPGDIVVVDRNCHKSILHAIIMTGAVPVFLMPTRNHYGIIGPIPLEEFSWENIQRKIAANPFARTVKNARSRAC
jgi:arginine decarboxylase